MADGLPDLALSYRRALIARLGGQRRYPAAALRQQAQGTGSLLFRIDREGRLLGAAMVSGTGHAALDQADIADRLGITRGAVEKQLRIALLTLASRLGEIDGHPIRFDLNIANLGGLDYWATSSQLGSPRNVAFAVKYGF